jgi:hypothetical protein
MNQTFSLDQPGAYKISVQGKLDARWADYFEEMQIEVTEQLDGLIITTLTGCLQDQAAVQGVLQKLYNLGFPLLSVEKL